MGVMETRLNLSLGFEAGDNVTVLPSDFVGNASDVAELAVGAEAEDLHGERNADTLLFVVRWWNSLEDLQLIQCDLSATSFVWNHA